LWRPPAQCASLTGHAAPKRGRVDARVRALRRGPTARALVARRGDGQPRCRRCSRALVGGLGPAPTLGGMTMPGTMKLVEKTAFLKSVDVLADVPTEALAQLAGRAAEVR